MRAVEDVEVQNTLNGGWTAGFEIVGRDRNARGDDAVQLRRVADGVLLPGLIEVDRVRRSSPQSQR